MMTRKQSTADILRQEMLGYDTQPRGFRTDQHYRRAMGLPLQYDQASYDWCLDYKEMAKHCITATGPRDWTKEEMTAYLD